MKIIIGLGNPGNEYQKSRHNIGFIVLDKYASYRKMSFVKERNTLIAKRNLFTLIKPITYMNLSGKALTPYLEYINEMLVICDDIYLPLGEIRLRQSGSDGGHNGLYSIIDELDSINFNRMRIGVGQPANIETLSDYVLSDFSDKEIELLKKTADFAVNLIDCFIAKGFQAMLNFYSKNKKSYSEQIVQNQ